MWALGNGWGTTFYNSEVGAAGTLNLDSGGHTTLHGAKASGQRVVARVGSSGAGSLTISSPQDEEHFRTRETSTGFNVSIPLDGNASSFSFGLNRSELNLLAEYEAVRQQTAINAGTGGFDILVNGHTQLRGGAITTEGALGDSRLVTQTLAHESLTNRDVAEGRGMSVGVSYGQAGSLAGALAGSSIGYARVDTDHRSRTDSVVQGVVTVLNPALPTGLLEAQRSAKLAPLYDSLAPVLAELGTLDWGDYLYYLDYGYHWQAQQWEERANALYARAEALQARIDQINSIVYGSAATLQGINPSSLHQPLLHTFDRSKATQELRDGVAVTAAFGKAAFKAVGDEADKRNKAEQQQCQDQLRSSAACAQARERADGWREGERYKVLLHGIVGAISGGSAGALAGLTAEAASGKISAAIHAAGIPVGSPAHDALMLAAKTAVGSGLGGAQGAAAAFNADANNRMMHAKRWQQLIDACKSGAAGSLNSMDCGGLTKLAGVRSDVEGSRIEGLPGLLLKRNWDDAGAVVGAFLVDAATGDQRYALDLVDLEKLTSMVKERRLSYVRESEALTAAGFPICNAISLLCGSGANGISRGSMEGIHAFMGGRYTIIYSGSAIKLDDFIFKEDYPSIGQMAVMSVDWKRMAERYGGTLLGDAYLLLGDYFGAQNDATKFGAIKVTRIGPDTVQIAPNNFDFDLKGSVASTLKSGLRSREMLTLVGGLLAGGFSTDNGAVTYGFGRPVTVIFDGLTKIPPRP